MTNPRYKKGRKSRRSSVLAPRNTRVVDTKNTRGKQKGRAAKRKSSRTFTYASDCVVTKIDGTQEIVPANLPRAPRRDNPFNK